MNPDQVEIRLIVPIISGVMIILLGFLGLRKWQNISYRRFFYAMTSTGVWSITAAFAAVYAVENVLWADIEQFTSIFMPPLVLLLFANIPFRKDITSKRLKIFAVGSLVIVFLLSIFCPRCFSPIRIVTPEGNVQNVEDPFLYDFIILPYFIFSFSLAVYYAIRNLSRTTGRVRAQFVATLIGVTMGVFGSFLTNLFGFVFNYYAFLWAGPIFAIIPGISVLYLLVEAEAQE